MINLPSSRYHLTPQHALRSCAEFCRYLWGLLIVVKDHSPVLDHGNQSHLIRVTLSGHKVNGKLLDRVDHSVHNAVENEIHGGQLALITGFADSNLAIGLAMIQDLRTQ